MDRITKIIQETHHRFLNLFCMNVRHRNGEASEYYERATELGLTVDEVIKVEKEN